MECAADATVRPEKGKRTRVFIVDDSPMMCKVMERIFSDDDEIHVVGTAMSGQSAMDGLARCEVDVCTLDVNMPGMNGIHPPQAHHDPLPVACPHGKRLYLGRRTDHI